LVDPLVFIPFIYLSREAFTDQGKNGKREPPTKGVASDSFYFSFCWMNCALLSFPLTCALDPKARDWLWVRRRHSPVFQVIVKMVRAFGTAGKPHAWH